MAFTTTSDFTNEIISEIENKIGYRFTDKDKLVQAFVRSSYSQIGNNEILEFFGDTALGLVIVKKMAESYTYPKLDPEWLSRINEKSENKERNSILSDYTEGEMTEIKKTLVYGRGASVSFIRPGEKEKRCESRDRRLARKELQSYAYFFRGCRYRYARAGYGKTPQAAFRSAGACRHRAGQVDGSL